MKSVEKEQPKIKFGAKARDFRLVMKSKKTIVVNGEPVVMDGVVFQFRNNYYDPYRRDNVLENDAAKKIAAIRHMIKTNHIVAMNVKELSIDASDEAIRDGHVTIEYSDNTEELKKQNMKLVADMKKMAAELAEMKAERDAEEAEKKETEFMDGETEPEATEDNILDQGAETEPDMDDAPVLPEGARVFVAKNPTRAKNPVVVGVPAEKDGKFTVFDVLEDGSFGDELGVKSEKQIEKGRIEVESIAAAHKFIVAEVEK